MNNYNYVLINQDATSFLVTEREEMAAPFAKRWFKDVLDIINRNNIKNMGFNNE